MPTLIARTGPLAGRSFELDDEVVLGREDATITLSDEETSRRHAAIRVTAGAVVIEDLGSTNGTFVDGKRIAVATELSGGETIKLGQTVFDVVIEIAEPAPPAVDAGATKMASQPEPIADPNRTAVGHRPPPADAAPPAAEPDPDRTALRPRPEPEVAPPPPEPIADPDRTAVRPRPPAPEAAPPPPPTSEPVADPDRTSLRPRPGREPGREPAPAASAPPPPPPPPPAPPKPAAPARPARGVAPPEEQPFGAFAPPAGRKRGGIATRKLAPSLISFATIITTAAALVVYFIGR